jgi:uncharacterized membrane protein (DUF441 family)
MATTSISIVCKLLLEVQVLRQAAALLEVKGTQCGGLMITVATCRGARSH